MSRDLAAAITGKEVIAVVTVATVMEEVVLPKVIMNINGAER